MAYVSVTINANASGLTVSPSSCYYYVSGSLGSFSTKRTTTAFVTFTIPSRAYFKNLGIWSAKTGGVQLANSSGSSLYVDKTTFNPSGGFTAYVHWKRVAWGLTLDHQGGTATRSGMANNIEEGGWYTNSSLTTPLTEITPPTRSGYRFMGYFSQTGGAGTLYINPDGTFTTAFNTLILTAATTIYAHWTKCDTITVNPNGGTGGTSAFYIIDGRAGFWADQEGTTEITGITPPTKDGSVFLGCYSAASGGDMLIDDTATMTVSSSNWPSGVTTVYAHWRTLVPITLDANGGTGGSALIFYDTGDEQFRDEDGEIIYDDSIPVVPDPPPGNVLVGFFSQQTGGTQYTDVGAFLSALTDNPPQSALTLYAQYNEVAWVLTFDANGGTGGGFAFHKKNDPAGYWYEDAACLFPVQDADAIARCVQTPARTGYDFTGFWDAASGGNQMMAASMEFIPTLQSVDGHLTWYAQWAVRSYTLTFRYVASTGGTVQKSVTFGQTIGTLPTPVPDDPSWTFKGWYFNGEKVTASTVWRTDGGGELVTEWETPFGDVTDWFSMKSAALVPIASASGDTYHRITVAHGGKYESGVGDIGGIWRNPSVTYVVKANTTVNVQLGKAFAATYTGAGSTRKMAVSGYMITAVEIVTEVGKFPTVTVSAVANEGANAVNNFTENVGKFNVSVPVVARSKAQNLLGGISGGGNLQRVALVGTCDPVVCEENLMPCASDIVNGRYELTAETLAASMEAAPAAAGGFALVDIPKQGSESDYTRYTAQARKEMT